MRVMNHLPAAATFAALLFTPSLVSRPSVAPREEGHHLDRRDLVANARFGLAEAIGRALKMQPGKAVEAELEGEVEAGKTSVFFEVMIVTPQGALVEVRLDPATGAQIETEDAEDESDELPGFARALRHAELDLATLVGRAEGVVKGFAVKAALEFEHGDPVCDVVVANSRWLIDVDLEARAGHLREIELEPESHGHGEEADGGEEHGKDEGHGKNEEDEDDEKGEKSESSKPSKKHGKAKGEEEEEEEHGEEAGEHGEKK
jgi:hypothetical protein